jgi:hypothetical protein
MSFVFAMEVVLYHPKVSRYCQNNDMMMITLSAVETTCVVEGSTLIEEKKEVLLVRCTKCRRQSTMFIVVHQSTVRCQ